MTHSDRIIARLKKILGLARQGVGGEKVNAQRMLDKLLQAYGLTLDDLDDEFEQRAQCEFSPRNPQEYRLLCQCVAATVADWDGSVYKLKRSRKRWFDLTRAEHMEVSLLFEVHRKALAAHLKKQAHVAWRAYIHTNKLFRKSNDDEEAPNIDIDIEETMQIIAMMRGMRPTPVHKALADNRR